MPMRRAVEFGLDSLLVATNEGRSVPLPLARFAGARRVLDPVTAMPDATRALLESYARKFEWPTNVISAAHLCRPCHVDLRGEPRRAPREPVYSRGSARDRRRHTAFLRLESSRPIVGIRPGLDIYRARVAVAHEL